MALGNGGKGTDKVRIGGAGTGDDIKGGGSDSVDIWEWELGGDGSDVDSYREFYFLVSKKIVGKTDLHAGCGGCR